METPDIESSTREERLEFVRNEFRCLGNCPICGKCSFLRGREAEDLYSDYIEGRRELNRSVQIWMTRYKYSNND